ncbi:MAG: molecular chaperone HscB [Verrucomicrobiota bacterium]|jgi:curved DNA-binding protein CbpA
MTDYFAVLGQPRRPWLDPVRLKERYQQLTLAKHPDRAGSSESDFALVNEGYRVLSNRKLRLQHLLSLQPGTISPNSAVPSEVAALFMETASLLEEVDRLLGRLKTADNLLSKALLQSEVIDLREKTGAALENLAKLEAGAVQELCALDIKWEKQSENVTEELAALSRRFAHLERWTEQLRERQFQLSI